MVSSRALLVTLLAAVLVLGAVWIASDADADAGGGVAPPAQEDENEAERVASRASSSGREHSRTKSARYYQRAAKRFDSALERAEKLKKRYASDAAVVAEAMRLIPHLSAAVQVTGLELANAYTSRGSYRQALDAVDRVVRLNPRNREALQLRRHIQLLEAVSPRA